LPFFSSSCLPATYDARPNTQSEWNKPTLDQSVVLVDEVVAPPERTNASRFLEKRPSQWDTPVPAKKPNEQEERATQTETYETDSSEFCENDEDEDPSGDGSEGAEERSGILGRNQEFEAQVAARKQVRFADELEAPPADVTTDPAATQA